MIEVRYSNAAVMRRQVCPMSQNERHVNILRSYLVKHGLIKNVPVISYVIIANPKTIISKGYAPKQIQECLKKYDQLPNLLKAENTKRQNESSMLEKQMYSIAQFLTEHDTPIEINYIDKFSMTGNDFVHEAKPVHATITMPTKVVEKPKECNMDGALCEALKKFRLETSRQESIKPYFIFNNEEMDSLIAKKPRSINELLEVKGFGPKKAEKYGETILNIFKTIK